MWKDIQIRCWYYIQRFRTFSFSCSKIKFGIGKTQWTKMCHKVPSIECKLYIELFTFIIIAKFNCPFFGVMRLKEGRPISFHSFHSILGYSVFSKWKFGNLWMFLQIFTLFVQWNFYKTKWEQVERLLERNRDSGF